MAQLERLPEAERASFRGRLLEAAALAAMDRPEEAEQRYQALIDEVPQRPEPYNNLAVLYAERGELDQALELLERAMQTSASYATVRDNLSRIYLEKSLSSYAKALRIEQREQTPRLQALYKASGMIPSTSPVVVAKAPAAAAPSPVKPPAVKAPVKPAAIAVAAVSSRGVEEAGESRAMPVQVARSTARAPMSPPPREPVIKAVKRWARAWQEQKVAVYLAAYAKDFVPPHGLSRAEWERQRHRRLRLPEQIEVGLEGIEVAFDSAAHARVEFVQRYRSDRYRDTTRKRLLLVKHDRQWQIREETTLEVIEQP
jgi:tetratricopeptide (TPR) repeat protein